MENTHLLNTCPHCTKPIDPNASYCTSCGYPLNGNEQAIKEFKLKEFEASQDKEENERHMRNGTTTLFVVAGLFMLGGVVVYAITKEIAELIFHAVFAAICVGLGFVSKKSTFAAVLIGIILYSVYVLLTIIGDPVNIVKGIIVKILVFLYLGRALRGALRMRKQNPEINFDDDANK